MESACRHVQWEDHFSYLVATLKNFSVNGILTDVTLVSGKQKIAIHQPVLAGFTSYFSEFVKTQNIVLMEEIDGAVVQGIIDYIYTGSASVPRNDVIKLYRTAELLKMEAFPQFESFNDSAVSHFTWPKHRNILLQCLWDSRFEPHECDVVFFTSDQCKSHAHTSVLAASSNFLLSTFQRLCEGKRKPYVIVLHNVVSRTLELVLEFCYKGEVKVIDEDLQSVCSVAKHLGIEKLCEQLIAVDPTLREMNDKKKAPEYTSIIRTSLLQSAQFQNILSSFLEHESLTDLLIFVDNQMFAAHSVILSAFSSYFRSLAKCLGQCMKEVVVLVKDLKACHIQALLDYVYKGEASFEGSVEEFCETLTEWLDFNLLPVSLECSKSTERQTEWLLEEKDLKEASITSDNQSDITSKDTDCAKEDQQLLTLDNDAVHNWQVDPVAENSLQEEDEVLEEKGLVTCEENDPDILALNKLRKTVSMFGGRFCYTCKETFPTRQEFRDHLAIHPDGRTLKCKYCKKGFGKPSQMKLHLRTHTGDRPYPCATCGMSFAAKSALTKHLDTHTTDKTKRAFVCDACSKSFSRKEYLEEHIRMHAGTKPYACPVCPKTFVGRTGLNHHSKTHAASEEKKRAVCEICGKSFTRHALWTHMKSHDKAHECDICHKFFATKTALKIHVAGTHFGHRRHQCEICGKGFMQKYHLIRHMKVHENEIEEDGDDPFACKKCVHTFKTESKLDAHMRSEHSEPGYSCNICHKRFAGRSTVIYHRRAHTGERPHRCSACGKTFVRPDTLRQHERSHTGERLFQCTVCTKKCATRSALNKHALSHNLGCAVCSKTFATKSELSEHSKVHTGTRPFRCNNCRKSFRYQDSLDKHLRIHSAGLGTTEELPCIYSFQVCRPSFEAVEDLNKAAGSSSYVVPREDVTTDGLQPYNIVSNSVCVASEEKNPISISILPRRPYSITIDGNLCCNNETLIPSDGNLVSSLTLGPEMNTPLLHQPSELTPETTYPSILSKAFSL